MMQTTLYRHDGTPQDKRAVVAHNMFRNYDKCTIELSKTARAGATTSCIIESINLGDQILVIEPTHDIIKNTVIKDIEKHKQGVRTTHVLSNKHCLLNLELMEQYPNLKQLDIIPLPEDCDKCRFNDQEKGTATCPVTRLLWERHPPDVIAITYHKLHAMLSNSDPTADNFRQKMLDKIMGTHNVLLDECHKIPYGIPTTISMKNYKVDDYKYIDENEYPATFQTMQHFKAMIQSPECSKATHAINGKLNTLRKFEHTISATFSNYNNIFELATEKHKSKVYKELTEMVMNKNKTPFYAIKKIYQILNLITADNVTIGYDKTDNETTWTLNTCEDYYLHELNDASKRTILTSATITGNKFEDMMCKPYHKVMFGGDGDPMQTNNKMTVFADSGKFQAYGKDRNITSKETISTVTIDIVNIVELFKDRYDIKRMVITTMNKTQYEIYKAELEKMHCNIDILYYNGDGTIGVKSDKRVMITINAAHKPANSFDALLDNSRIKNRESTDEDTMQCISRVKDPDGIEKSYVVMLGTNTRDATNLVTWGTDRTTTITDQTAGKQTLIDVVCGKYITKPNIVKKSQRKSWKTTIEAFLDAEK